jgi:uncharacterized membrane protein
LQIYYLLGIIIIGYGLRKASKGYAIKSKPRVLLGLSMVPVGASLFFQNNKPIAVALVILGVIIFVCSLLSIRREVGRRR